MGVVFWVSAGYKEVMRTTKVGNFMLSIQADNNLVIDWGDGSIQALNLPFTTVSHDYPSPGEKIIQLREGAKAIKILSGGNQSVTSLTLRSLGSLGGVLRFEDNTALRVLELPESQQDFTAIDFSNTGLSGWLDLSVIPNLTGTVRLSSLQNITRFIFGAVRSGAAALTLFYLQSSGHAGAVNVQGLTNLGGDVRFLSNPNLTQILFPATANNVTTLLLSSNNLTGELDISMLKATGTVTFFLNPNLTSVKLNPANTYTGQLYGYQCNLTGVWDLSGITGNWNNFRVYSNPNLTGLVFGPNTNFTGTFYAYSCQLNQAFPLGTAIKGTDIRLYGNGMSTANVNATIDNLYQNRAAFATTAKTLSIHGTNAAPTGTALTQIADLRANHNWTITHS